MHTLPHSLFSPRTILAFAASLVAACSGSGATTSADADEAPINGGTAENSGDPAVGLVMYVDGNWCSGSLIAPNVVLTAGHCSGGTKDGFYTYGGNSTRVPGMTHHPIRTQLAHPSFKPWFACPDPTPDVALLRLADAVTNIKPLHYAPKGTKLPPAHATLTAIGYGEHHNSTGNADEGIYKRRATELFIDAQPFGVQVAHGTGIADHGDSGGPIVFGGKIIGTASCITAEYPEDYTAYYGRVEAVADWIDVTVRSWSGG